MRFSFALLVVLAMPAAAQTTFTVTTTADAGAGSLRQAITDANANAGADVIAFNIPGDGVQTIRPQSALPEVLDIVTIDGLTQPGAACDSWPATLRIEIDGSQAGDAEGLRLYGPGSVVRGLAIGGFGETVKAGVVFEFGADDSTITCSYIGTNAAGAEANPNWTGVDVDANRVRIGGPEPGERNLISGNEAFNITVTHSFISGGPEGAMIQGNFIGPDVTGTQPLSEDASAGVYLLNADRTQIGGTDHTEWTCDRACNLISGNGGGQINANNGADETIIEGNFIGTDLGGTVALIPLDPDGFGFGDGVSLTSFRSRIGGTAPGAGNLISGNGDSGICLFALAGENVIQGNRIGTDRTGTQPLGNGSWGIALSETRESVIGGPEPGAGNLIAYNVGGIAVGFYPFISFDDGAVGQTPFKNRISGNSIYANRGLGIDLAGDGPTGGSTVEQIGGPNLRINRPELDLDKLSTQAGTATVTGIYRSFEAAPYRIEVFASPSCDPERFGPGQRYLGAFDVTTDASGQASYTETLASPGLPAGWILTATATDVDGNTSEFSQCLPFPDDPLVVRTTADSGPGSLRGALEAANALFDRQTITFDIPPSDPGCDGSGACTIRPDSLLSPINGPVVIDGTSQPGSTCGDGPATIKVALDGRDELARALGFIGISQGSEIRGLAIGGFTGGSLILDLARRFNDPGGEHLIECTHIGTDASGTVARPNGTGITVNTFENQIGTPGRGNLISGNRAHGISVAGSWRSQIQANRIGTDRSGTAALGNGETGIFVVSPYRSSVRYVLVGGTEQGEGNLIAHNGSDGVQLRDYLDSSSPPRQVSIWGNSFRSNGGLAINLCPEPGAGVPCDGATPNDEEDRDAGPNYLLNTPEILDARVEDQTISASYRLVPPPGRGFFPFRVEFYLADADGQEGETYIGSDTYTHDDFTGGPEKSIELTPGVPFQLTQRIVATATEQLGSTSEFSALSVPIPLEPMSDLPEAFALDAPWPNPVRQRATVRVALPEASRLTVEVFDALGRRVRQLEDADRPAGWHELALDADGLASGVYLVRMTVDADRFIATRRLTVVR